MAGMLLAGLGADVVRVLPSGTQPGCAPEDLAWDRGKRFASGGPSDADIVLSDGPRAELDGVAAPVRVWLPPHTVSGPYADLPDDPLLRSALGGFASFHPSYGGGPVASVVPLYCAVQGALGATAAAAGLLGAGGTGAGGTATVSGLHAMAALLTPLAVTALDAPKVYSSSATLPGVPNYRAYQAGDGRWLYLAALKPEFFFAALNVLDRVDVMVMDGIDGEFQNLLMLEKSAPVGEELAATFARRPRDEWLTDLAEAGVPAAPVWTREEWLAGPYHDGLVTLDHPVLGPVTMPDVPVRVPAGLAGSTGWEGSALIPGGVPLAGLKIIDLSTFLAAPFAGTLLAGHGADVVKVERPGGDPYRVYRASYTPVNQGKTISELDLRVPHGLGKLLEQIRDADVLIDNLTPSAMDRLGLGDAALAEVNPALVRCSVSTFGRTGAFGDLPGFDPVLQAMSGMAAAQGGDDYPVPVSSPVHDVGTSALAALGILAGLYARARDGRGRHVTASLAATAGFLQCAEMTVFDGRPRAPVGGRDYPGPSAAHRLHAASDGWLAVAATTKDQIAALLAAAGVPSAETGEPDADELDAGELARAFASRPVEDWLAELAARGVPACPVIDRDRALRDPVLGDDYTHVIRDEAIGRLRVARCYAEWEEPGGARHAPRPGISPDMGVAG